MVRPSGTSPGGPGNLPGGAIATGADLLWSLPEPIGHRTVFAVKQASYS